MEYSNQFELDFMKRTLEIVKDYQGERDATLLINCLLGLLVVPKETLFNKIPKDPITALKNWGFPLSQLGVLEEKAMVVCVKKIYSNS